MTTRSGAGPRTLAVDIGGTDLKAVVLDARGRPQGEGMRTPTPAQRTPDLVLDAVVTLARSLAPFDRASVGFPGPIDQGRILTAVNFSDAWVGLRLQSTLRRRLRVPVRVANDADVQGFGAMRGKGVELVLTLGTGLGSALFVDGTLVPNLEIGHHPFRRGRTYEQLLGLKALKKNGVETWRGWLDETIESMRRVFTYRTLYLGGGNARLVEDPLPPNVRVVSNRAGLLGGWALWRDVDGR